jgi:DNA modification methylase
MGREPDWSYGGVSLYGGDVLHVLQQLPAGLVRCAVTSPPYWGLRDYGVEGQLGLEKTPDEYVSRMVEVFREVRRVLRDDGTLWLNLGDSYCTVPYGTKGANTYDPKFGNEARHRNGEQVNRRPISGLKHKDLVGIPWRVAFALQADGWYLRQDIIWHKPNPIPESVRDRCTKAHEYIFLLSKSERYYYDAEAISEPCSPNTHARMSQDVMHQEGSHRAAGGGKTNGPMRAVVKGSTRKLAIAGSGVKTNDSFEAACSLPVTSRNRRSVWTVTTKGYSGAHFATFPPKLIEPCILAGCPEGGTVLDPFMGSGTTGEVSLRLGRRCVGIELNPDYLELCKQRIGSAAERFGLFAQAV